MEDVSHDLLFIIFGRLDLKSLCSCRLVCKRWASIIDSPDFARSFQARPNNQACFILGTWIINQGQNHHLSIYSSSPSFHDRVRKFFFSRQLSTTSVVYDCVHGLISHERTIMNPSLGWAIEIPLISPNDSEEQRFLGFDPISAQYKLLALRVDKRSGRGDYQVLTVGEDSNSWRIVNSSTPELPKTESICIDGMVYYFVHSGGTCSLVIFNVATETLNFFPVADGDSYSLGLYLDAPNTSLLNYKGKLGFVSRTNQTSFVHSGQEFGLWVLDDVENQTWSKLSFSLPRGYFHYTSFGAPSVNHDTGDIVLCACDYRGSMQIVFINVDTGHIIMTEFLKNSIYLLGGFAIREYRESTMRIAY